jgi:hypothetical protein
MSVVQRIRLVRHALDIGGLRLRPGCHVMLHSLGLVPLASTLASHAQVMHCCVEGGDIISKSTP